jgi:hypothetical protein
MGTTISSRLADKLKLPAEGKTITFGSEGCRGTARKIKLPAFSIEGVPVRSRAAYIVRGPGLGGSGAPQGTIGADVLSRFDAERVDFVRETLTFLNRKQPWIQGGTVHGSVTHLPKSLVAGKPQIAAPMVVRHRDGGVAVRVLISLRHRKRRSWLPDTGSRDSAVDPAIARQANLKPLPGLNYQPSLCSKARLRVKQVRSGPWAIAGQKLKPQVLTEIEVANTAHVTGVFGAGTMSKYGSVVFDWGDRRLLLGTR